MMFSTTLFCSLLFFPIISSLPLDDYVSIDDGAFSWELLGESFNGTLRDGKWSAVALNVSTQYWQPENWVHDNSKYPSTSGLVWHLVLVVTPEVLNPDRDGQSLVYITGGSNGNTVNVNELGFGDEDLTLVAELAVRTGAIACVVYNDPNEAIRFLDEEGTPRRTESAIDAYTWKQYMDGYDNMTSHDDDDPTFTELSYQLMIFQQVKSADRCMTAIEQYTASIAATSTSSATSEWIVCGASKRGWTTWLTAAYDAVRQEGSRVAGIMPVVFDDLNFQQNLHHHFQAYGGWSFALEDYWSIGDMTRLDTPAFDSLASRIDPYAYKDRLKIPKLVLNAGGDEFFLPDDWRYWISDEPFIPNDMNHSKAFYLLAPNTEHSYLFGLGEIVPVMATWSTLCFNQLFLNNDQTPNFQWEINYGNYKTQEDASITVTLNNNQNLYESVTVTLWVATTCSFHRPRRDFRMENIDASLAEFDGKCGCGPLGNESVVIDDDEGSCLNFQAHYVPTLLQPVSMSADGGDVYQGIVSMPDYDIEKQIYKSFFIDVTFHKVTGSSSNNLKEQVGTWPVSSDGDLEYTTQAVVIPDYFPYPDCEGDGCEGSLV